MKPDIYFLVTKKCLRSINMSSCSLFTLSTTHYNNIIKITLGVRTVNKLGAKFN